MYVRALSMKISDSFQTGQFHPYYNTYMKSYVNCFPLFSVQTIQHVNSCQPEIFQGNLRMLLRFLRQISAYSLNATRSMPIEYNSCNRYQWTLANI